MDLKQRKKLKNTIISILAKENITFKEVDSISKDERQDVINNELLRINKIALQWALHNKVITADDLREEKFITSNRLLSDFIADAGLGALGVGGAFYTFSAVTAPTFFGLVGGGLATLTAGGAALVALPVIVVGLGIYGKAYYKNQKEVEELIEYFNKEKMKIQNFYLSKINKMKEIKALPPKTKKEIQPNIKKTEKQISKNKTTTSTNKPSKEKIKPIVKKPEKDIYYDKCVVRYDNACTIKHRDDTWDKKDGLNHKTFNDSIDRVLEIIGDIFNMVDIEIIFFGIKSDAIVLKKKVKIFEKDNNIEKAIKITFIDITKNRELE